MERTIKVRANGFAKREADQTTVRLAFSRIYPTYHEAMAASTVDVKEIKKILTGLGLERKQLITDSFNVDVEYTYPKDNTPKKFVGYRYVHKIHFSFGIDNDLLGKVLYQIGQYDVYTDIKIEFGLQNRDDIKDEALANAMKEARKKALIMTDAIGVELGDVVDIKYGDDDYSYREQRFELGCYKSTCVDELGRYDIDIESGDVNACESVAVEFLIK